MALPDVLVARLLKRIDTLGEELAARYPGDATSRQPVHTVYGGAHLFRADIPRRLGDLARQALDRYAASPAELAAATGMLASGDLVGEVYRRVVDKLSHEPVEDYRIDFEDGYGDRDDAEEDGHATKAAGQLLRGAEAATLPPFVGIRIKPLTPEGGRRALRTLDLFFTGLWGSDGGWPVPTVVTLPKVVHPRQVAVLTAALSGLEESAGMPVGAIGIEVMVETPPALIAMEQSIGIWPLVEAGEGRVRSLHLGPYDLTASLSISATHQALTHPVCDFARHLMQMTLAGSGVRVVDGPTNVVPVPVHRGNELLPQQEEENLRTIHGAWRLHYTHVRHSLSHGFYQGWDVHPVQLVSRYAAVYSFFLETLEAAAARFRNYRAEGGRASTVGDVFDDAATGRGLLNHFLRGLNCGALTEDEVISATGLEREELLRLGGAAGG